MLRPAIEKAEAAGLLMPSTPVPYCTTPGCPRRVPRGGSCSDHVPNRDHRLRGSRCYPPRRRLAALSGPLLDLRLVEDAGVLAGRSWRRHRQRSSRRPWRWAKVRAAVLRRDPFCRACTRAPSVEVDHVVPRSRGGAVYDPANLQGLCRRCHRVKTNRDRRTPADAPGRTRVPPLSPRAAVGVDRLEVAP